MVMNGEDINGGLRPGFYPAATAGYYDLPDDLPVPGTSLPPGPIDVFNTPQNGAIAIPGAAAVLNDEYYAEGEGMIVGEQIMGLPSKAPIVVLVIVVVALYLIFK